MAIVTIDTDVAVRRLRDAGFDERQIETVMRVLADVQERLAMRERFGADLAALESRLIFKVGVMLAIAVIAIISAVKV